MKITVKKDKPPERKLKAVLMDGNLYTESWRDDTCDDDCDDDCDECSGLACLMVCSGITTLRSGTLGSYAQCMDAVSIYEGDTIEVTF